MIIFTKNELKLVRIIRYIFWGLIVFWAVAMIGIGGRIEMLDSMW